VRRRTVGFADERLDVLRVVLFFGAGIQETYQNFRGRELPRTRVASDPSVTWGAQHLLLPKGSRPNRAELPTRLIAQPNTIGEPSALNFGGRNAAETLKTHRTLMTV
jgi:hypothetical protein